MARRAEKVAWTAIEGGAMPIFEGRRPGRRRRFVALVTAVLASCALMAPSSASAGEDWFCVGVWLHSGWECRTDQRHTLWSVGAYVSNAAPYRICVASATSYWGSQSSDWRCDYTSVSRDFYGSVYGVGVVRNGAPYGWSVGAAAQWW
jgi:hypothetical protein